ncbi:MAG: sialate O-acetylesterase [Planctomycetota bacterium]
MRSSHLILAGLVVSVAPAQVTLPAILSDHMVLQRNAPIRIWGRASDGESVTVEFRDQSVSTTATGGQWRVELAPEPAGGPDALTVRGTNTVTLDDVMVGEVWLCAGQSNMHQRLELYATGRAALPTAGEYNLRLHRVDRQPGSWVDSQPETAHSFSAIGFFFGRDLSEGVFGRSMTIGLIQAAKSGTLVEEWLPGGPQFETLIRRVIPLPIRGVIWYQGEADTNPDPRQPDLAHDYASRFRRVVREWRSAWGHGNFPFLFCQLPAYTRGLNYWPELREAQLDALAEPNTAMACQIDVLATHLHPPNKLLMGQRLGAAAQRIVYGANGPPMGPIYAPHSSGPVGDEFVVGFEHVGSGLHVPGGRLTGFEIADASLRFVPGNARLHGDTVVVSAPGVMSPVAVRYAWGVTPAFSLFNREGLPASPFRTAARFEQFGSGCGGAPPGHLESTLLPRASRHFEVRLSQLAPGQPGVLLLGASHESWLDLPLPMPLGALQLPGCELLVSGEARLGFTTDSSGDATLRMRLPAVGSVLGVELFVQGIALCPGVTAAGLCLTHAGRAVVGPR